LSEQQQAGFEVALSGPARRFTQNGRPSAAHPQSRFAEIGVSHETAKLRPFFRRRIGFSRNRGRIKIETAPPALVW
jgi:hypothetical protein